MLICAACALDLIALTGAWVHSQVPGQAARVATVLIEGDRIKAVGTELAIPPEARVIDLAGMHLAPGLIDGLIGFDSDHDALYLSSGITLVRDIGNALDRLEHVRDRANRDAAPGPAVLSAGTRIEGNRPSTPSSLLLPNEVAVEKIFPQLLELHPDYLYMASALDCKAWKKLLELAAPQRLELWGPLPPCSSLEEALAAGQRGYVYLDWLLPKDIDWQIVQSGAFAASVKTLGAAKARLVPVLQGLAARLTDPGTEPPQLALLSPMYAASWMAELDMRRSMRAKDPSYQKTGERAVKKQAQLLKQLSDAGVHLVPGSGAPSAWLMPGQGLHDELASWCQAGLAPADVLRLATAGAADAIGQGAQRGTIEPGKLADLVAVSGDPEQDLAVLRKPAWVVLRGRPLERQELDALEQRTRDHQADVRRLDQQPLAIEAPQCPPGTVLLSGHVETRAQGMRVSGERYAIVRESDGRLAYCGRVLIPSDGSLGQRELEVTQRTRGGILEEFEVKLKNGAHELVARGLLVAGRMAVERRMDGVFLSNDGVRERVTAVEAGSITSELVLGQVEQPGRLALIYFNDGLTPELVPWELELKDKGRHLVRTPEGGVGFVIGDDGSLKQLRETRGPGLIELVVLETDTHGGAGLPLPESKRLLKSAPETRPASGSAPAGG